MADPDYVYDPDDWEYTHEWKDRDDMAEDQCDEIKRFCTLMKGPDKFCVRIDREYRWFNTRGEAEAAWKAAAVSEYDGGGAA